MWLHLMELDCEQWYHKHTTLLDASEPEQSEDDKYIARDALYNAMRLQIHRWRSYK